MTPKVALVLLLKYLGMLQTVLLEVGLEMLTPVARHAYLLLQIPPVVLPATLNSQPLLVPFDALDIGFTYYNQDPTVR